MLRSRARDTNCCEANAENILSYRTFRRKLPINFSILSQIITFYIIVRLARTPCIRISAPFTLLFPSVAQCFSQHSRRVIQTLICRSRLCLTQKIVQEGAFIIPDIAGGQSFICKIASLPIPFLFDGKENPQRQLITRA